MYRVGYSCYDVRINCNRASSRDGTWWPRTQYTLHAHAPGDPRKMWGNRILSYTLRLSSIELYVMQNPRTITMVTRPVAMDTPAHARSVYQALSPPPLEGPGYEASEMAAFDKGAFDRRLRVSRGGIDNFTPILLDKSKCNECVSSKPSLFIFSVCVCM